MKPLGKDPQGKAQERSKRIRRFQVRGSTVRFVMVSSHWVTDKLISQTHACKLCFLLTCQCISWGNWSMCLSSSTQNQTLPVPGGGPSRPSCAAHSGRLCLRSAVTSMVRTQPQGHSPQLREGSGLCLCGKNIRIEKSWDVKTVRYEKHTHHIPAFKKKFDFMRSFWGTTPAPFTHQFETDLFQGEKRTLEEEISLGIA